MSKNQIIIALVVLCLLGTIWGSVQDKKSASLERQLAAMKEQPAPAAAVVDDFASKLAQADLEELRSQNETLLTEAATLKGVIASQEQDIAECTEQQQAVASGSQAVGDLQARLDKSTAELSELKEASATLKAELEEKKAALAAAEASQAGLEDVKTTLANNVDVYSAKSQKLSVEVEECKLRVSSLEKALEERTKVLLANEEELARTKLNMNVLLSKIEAQNNSLTILEETRTALAKELAAKFLAIEELERQLGTQVAVETEGDEEEQAAEAVPVEESPAQH